MKFLGCYFPVFEPGISIGYQLKGLCYNPDSYNEKGDILNYDYMMIKSYWAFILFLALMALDSGKAFAEYFSTEIAGHSRSGILTPGEEIQVAQAIPEPEEPEAEVTLAFPDFDSRFAKGQYQFGFSFGYGSSFNLAPIDANSEERTHLRFIQFFPNFKYNLTGPMGKSIFQGALYWVVEVGFAATVSDPTRNNQPVGKSPEFLIGLVPAQLEYKFINPERSWAPFLFAGVGVSWSEWFQDTSEIATAFEFILQVGGGIEYFFDNGTAVNLHYRLWHLSNSNIQSRNIGINAHVVSLGYSF